MLAFESYLYKKDRTEIRGPTGSVQMMNAGGGHTQSSGE